MQIHRRKHARGYRVILHKLWQGLPFRVAALKIFPAIWNEREIESVHKNGVNAKAKGRRRNVKMLTASPKSYQAASQANRILTGQYQA